MVLRWTGARSPQLQANSAMATQAYWAFADNRIERLLRGASDSAAFLMLDDVQATFLLELAGPAPRAFVVAMAHGLGARPATDAWVALVVQRIVRHIVLGDEAPHVLFRPVEERIDLHQ